jgi:hypothetical protein
MDSDQNIINTQYYKDRYHQQKFLEHASFALHYERQKIISANNAEEYYKYAELENYHKTQAIHYKGLFSAESTLDESNRW